MFDRELTRSSQLDKEINTPLTLLTVIAAIVVYNLKQLNLSNICELISHDGVFLLIIGLSYILSIFTLIKSYNNLFKGFNYLNLSKPTSLREYETTEINTYNNQVATSEKINFENELINEVNKLTDYNIAINDNRSYDLYYAKTLSILTIILSGIHTIILTVINTQI